MTENFLEGINLEVIVANTYFDHSDVDNPVKTYLKSSPVYNFELDKQKQIDMSIKPSEIRHLNGNTDMVYELASIDQSDSTHNSFAIFSASISFGPYYDVYQLKEDFAENLEKEVHHPVFIMAQIGGIYSFLKLMFDIVIAPIYQKTLIFQIINSYKARRQYHQQKSQWFSQNPQELVGSNKEESKMHEGGSSDENEDIAKSIRRGKRLDVSDSNDSIHQRIRTNPKKVLNKKLPKISSYDIKDALFDTFACCCRKMSKQ